MALTRTAKLKVHSGDITELEVDAVVNAANDHLWMGAGVAGAIKRKGGAEIEREATSKGPVPVGSAVVTGAGALKAGYVIHAAVMGQDLKTDASKIANATRSTLKEAAAAGLRSIAFPAFGTGVGGFSMPECASIMVRCVVDWIAERPGDFDEIIFALIDPRAAATFQKAIDDLAG